MESINQLLTRYVDSLNSGAPLDINDLVKLCSESEQQEFKQLCNMAKAFKRCSPVIKRDQRKEDHLFSHLEALREERQKKTYHLTSSGLDRVAEDHETYRTETKTDSDK